MRDWLRLARARNTQEIPEVTSSQKRVTFRIKPALVAPRSVKPRSVDIWGRLPRKGMANAWSFAPELRHCDAAAGPPALPWIAVPSTQERRDVVAWAPDYSGARDTTDFQTAERLRVVAVARASSA